MKIAFLLYGLTQNGGNKVLFRVGNLLQHRGHDVCYHVAETERELPYPSSCRFVFAQHHYPNAIGRVRWLARVVLNADIAIATSHPTSFALVWNRSLLTRRLYYVQAYEPDFYSDSPRHLLTRWPMMLAAGASYLLPLEKIVNCEGSRRGLVWKDRKTAPELPPGIDLSLYRPAPRPEGELVVGHISRHEPWKGSDHFFRAMVRLRELGYQFRVRVAYDLWPETYGLEYNVARPKDESELAQYYSGLDVLVSTVKQKGFGYPPLEAMACGALCLSTPMDFGSPMVDHIPILANSSASIVQAMRKVFAPGDRNSFITAGLKTAANYDWEKLGDHWCQLLSDIASDCREP